MALTTFSQKHARELTSMAVQKWYNWVDIDVSPVILDGGLGHILLERGNDLSSGKLWSGRLLVTNKNELADVAKMWLEAGADIILTATYQTSADQLMKEFDMSTEESAVVFRSSVEICADARQNFIESARGRGNIKRRPPKIGASLGPYSATVDGLNEYDGQYGDISYEEIFHFHEQRCTMLQGACVDIAPDVYCFETIGNEVEARAIVDVMSMESNASTPYWISFQCKDDRHLASGELISGVISTVIDKCISKNLVALGVNCVPVKYTQGLVERIGEAISIYMSCFPKNSWRIDIVAYPDSGEVWGQDGYSWPISKPLSSEEWADIVYRTGAKMFGGCCRVGPDQIRALLARVLQSDSTKDTQGAA